METRLLVSPIHPSTSWQEKSPCLGPGELPVRCVTCTEGHWSPDPGTAEEAESMRSPSSDPPCPTSYLRNKGEERKQETAASFSAGGCRDPSSLLSESRVGGKCPLPTFSLLWGHGWYEPGGLLTSQWALLGRMPAPNDPERMPAPNDPESFQRG